ncbi:MAG TPA: transposase [Thiotrichaceae bacterium]|jgi:transposase|nr:transposase [Thiotrichaceae bacterium]HIM07776.1 transposase [Gammaproteobacteria bacterium]
MSNKKYSKSYKLDAVKMALSSAVSQAQVARELGLKENCLYNWISQYRGEVLGTHHDMTPEQELAALKKEVVQLRQEREILKKAAAYFAQHQA